jgi:hypothetical protein
MKIFGIILGGLFLAFAAFIYFTSRNYSVTKQQVVDLLRGVLNNTTDWGEWDNFTHIPITNDSGLENIRKKCFELEQKEFSDAEGKYLYNERGMAEIRKILTELENEKPI